MEGDPTTNSHERQNVPLITSFWTPLAGNGDKTYNVINDVPIKYSMELICRVGISPGINDSMPIFEVLTFKDTGGAHQLPTFTFVDGSFNEITSNAQLLQSSIRIKVSNFRTIESPLLYPQTSKQFIPE